MCLKTKTILLPHKSSYHGKGNATLNQYAVVASPCFA